VQTFISSTLKSRLEANQLGNFEQLWNYRGEWFEAPNYDRGGWSGVNRLILDIPGGGQLALFLKRQQSYVRRTFLHPLSGVTTFFCEYEMIRCLQSRGVPVPTLVFFGQKSSADGAQAILVTEELLGYQSIDCVVKEVLLNPAYSRKQIQAVIACAAKAVRSLHDARVQHRALHSKHLLVNLDAPRAAIIDFEKARIKLFPISRTRRDLATLNRDIVGLSRSTRLYFFKQYLGVEKLGFWSKLLCRLVISRSRKSKRQYPQEVAV
jgi:aminoglycoside phosphotransferase (APT) family kinase protein